MVAAPVTLLAFVAALLSVTACPYADQQRRNLKGGDGGSGGGSSAGAPAGATQYTTTPCTKQDLTAGITALYSTVEGTPALVTAKLCFDSAVKAINSKWDKSMTGPVLRAAFHDCGTWSDNKPQMVWGLTEPAVPFQCGGCNGSFQKEFQYGLDHGFGDNSGKGFPQQDGMQAAYNLYKQVFPIIQQGPCAKMSKADIISISGHLAVQKSGGSPAGGCAWHPGRQDQDNYDDTSNLPGESLKGDGMQAKFASYGNYAALQHFEATKNMAQAVTLYSGAHTVGQSRRHDKSPTSQGLGALSGTPDKFDGGYYTEVVTAGGYKGMNGWFESDRHGLCNELPAGSELQKRVCKTSDSPLLVHYKKYSDNFLKNNDEPFRKDFCQALQAMSTIGFEFPPDYDNTASNFII